VFATKVYHYRDPAAVILGLKELRKQGLTPRGLLFVALDPRGAADAGRRTQLDQIGLPQHVAQPPRRRRIRARGRDLELQRPLLGRQHQVRQFVQRVDRQVGRHLVVGTGAADLAGAGGGRARGSGRWSSRHVQPAVARDRRSSDAMRTARPSLARSASLTGDGISPGDARVARASSWWLASLLANAHLDDVAQSRQGAGAVGKGGAPEVVGEQADHGGAQLRTNRDRRLVNPA
jgi:hypothetical protein